jgi:hypothetical protein
LPQSAALDLYHLVACPGEIVLTAAHHVLDALVDFVVPGAPGCCRDPLDQGEGVEVVPQQGCTEGLPAAPGILHRRASFIETTPSSATDFP